MELLRLDRDATFYVAGHHGLVGSAVWRYFAAQGFEHLVGMSSAELDLRDRRAVFEFFRDVRPRYCVMAAARVGGILANATTPAEFVSDNLQIQVNVFDAARSCAVERLLFLGSSCVYPKFARQPIIEESLLSGSLEATNVGYAIAKIAGLLHLQAMRRQYGVSYISAMPTNLYGPGDNFDRTTSHVLPGMLRRFHEASRDGVGAVTLWGSGTPRREFLHVDDLARACLVLLERYDGSMPVNIGTGRDISIRMLADIVAEIVGYHGTIDWDRSKPDGTPRKLLSVARIRCLGWEPQVSLADGIRDTYQWYVSNNP